MDELDKLFLAYRDTYQEADPSASFTPGIWRKIEARRSPLRMIRRVAEAFVATAAIVAVLVGVVLIPRMQNASFYSTQYVDVLAANASDIAPYTEVIHSELEAQQQ